MYVVGQDAQPAVATDLANKKMQLRQLQKCRSKSMCIVTSQKLRHKVSSNACDAESCARRVEF